MVVLRGLILGLACFEGWLSFLKLLLKRFRQAPARPPEAPPDRACMHDPARQASENQSVSLLAGACEPALPLAGTFLRNDSPVSVSR